MSNPVNATIYHNPYSICALMTRLTYRYRGVAQDSSRAVVADEKLIDIFTFDQLSEHYLCEMNPKGEVPTLHIHGGPVIPDSVAITHYLADIYPQLIPSSHKTEIKQMIHDLHQVSYFALTYGTSTGVTETLLSEIEKRRVQATTDRYREALEWKYQWVKDHRQTELTQDNIDATVKFVRGLMETFEAALDPSHPDWMFGLRHPSALDAHLAVFVARMNDMGRQELIPERLQQYAARIFATDEWNDVLQGRSTDPVVHTIVNT